MTVRTYNTGNAWPVGAKKYAIAPEPAAIALRYGNTVSKGIKAMEARIKELENENATMGAWVDVRGER